MNAEFTHTDSENGVINVYNKLKRLPVRGKLLFY